MADWYLSYDGQQIGPFDLAEARQRAQSDSDGFAWRSGMADWLPINHIGELHGSSGGPPPVTQAQHALTRRSDEIDYEIFGNESQYVVIELDPGESAVAEAGAMMYKDASIEMTTLFGDGSGGQDEGFMDKLLGAGKRLITGESLFTTVFTHQGHGKAHVAFAAPFPGNIMPVHLGETGGRLICQKDSFLCAAKGVSIGIYFQKKILTGLFGGEGFIMQKLEGDGMAFVQAGGALMERQLGAGEVLHVDTGCLVAMQDSVQFDLQQAGGIKTALFGGEGLFFAQLRGPGRIWLQSLPFSRFAGRMLAAAPQGGGRDVGEGSLLGGIGDIVMGNRKF
ncbi:MAG: TIGR00266 family protein [Gammaproteobacteria bacterium SHHR-1]|uniref:TIGR00266 family protein n=1 Tax=Magnetovirga frankeli TaxID=947516 RepID=UPI0012936CBE|nr:TIGR00266 family protein [gamma proteobacterium SS-5]